MTSHSQATERVRPVDVLEWKSGQAQRVTDQLAIEEPLEIRVGGVPVSVTMRTPGDDLDLAAGFLFTERIIDGPDDLANLMQGGVASTDADNVVNVTLREGRAIDLTRLQRHFYAASSCGVCGKASMSAVRVRDLPRPSRDWQLDVEVVYRLPALARAAQSAFERTGGLHAAALFDRDGTLLTAREDIGRHNAVDKVIGHALRERRLPLDNCIMFISGRGAFEIVQKALTAGVPVIAGVSAPSSLAVDLARENGLTLIGFLRDRRFVVYSGPERLASADGSLRPTVADKS
jgi:FdhD protein